MFHLGIVLSIIWGSFIHFHLGIVSLFCAFTNHLCYSSDVSIGSFLYRPHFSPEVSHCCKKPEKISSKSFSKTSMFLLSRPSPEVVIWPTETLLQFFTTAVKAPLSLI